MKVQNPHEGVENGFVKIALEGVGAQKLNRQGGRADEWSQDPRKLSSKKKIPRQPREKNTNGHVAPFAEVMQQLQQSQIGGDAGEGDDEHEREQDRAVRTGGFPGVRRHRREIPHHESDDGSERPENGTRDGEAHKNREKRLAEGNVEPQQRREHRVKQGVAGGGEQNDEREFDGGVQRLLGRAPPAHRRAVKPGAEDDNGEVQENSPRVPLRAPGFERMDFAAQEHAQARRRGVPRSGVS